MDSVPESHGGTGSAALKTWGWVGTCDLGSALQAGLECRGPEPQQG